MPDSLLTVLRLLLLALIWLFFLRVLVLLATNPKTLAVSSPAPSGGTKPSAAPAPRPAPSGKPTLRVVSSGDLAHKEFVVGTEATVGRGQGCQVQLAEQMVSQLHARLFRTDSGLHVEDLGSTNGTYLNGRRVGGPAKLRKGDRIRVGPVELEVLG